VGLTRLAKHLGLQGLGAIGYVPLEDLQHAKTYATDIQVEQLQAQSFHKMKEEFGKFARGAKTAAGLLGRDSSSARVSGDVIIAKGQRLLYLAPHWRPFGGSQQGIASRLGVSLRTVQNRLSNAWREERGISTIEKRQAAHQVFEEAPKEFLKDFMRVEENSDQKYIWLGRRLFERGCNLYDTGISLLSLRRRKAEYKAAYYNSTAEVDVFKSAPLDTTLDYRVCDSGFKNLLEPETSLQNC
jgi:hypothetical protein